MSEINSKLFNVNKSDYGNTALFLAEDPGLGDTINRPHPDIWDLYKTLKSQDWDEHEWNYSTCRDDFVDNLNGMGDLMIAQIAWQWEADTTASRSILGVFGPFIANSELFAAWSMITHNENVHWSTYSEIVRMSFDDPREVIDEVTQMHEALDRLTITGKVLSETYTLSHRYALGEVENDQETYNQVLLGVAALYLLERVQFMASFAITFGITDQDLFLPIGKAVQKIAMDEYEIHTELDRLIFQKEFQTDRGKAFLAEHRHTVEEMIDDTVQGEFEFLAYVYDHKGTIPGVTLEMLYDWVRFMTIEVREVFGLPLPENTPKQNPLPYMADWLDLDRFQDSPMEEQSAQYRTGVLVNDDDDEDFSNDL